MVTNCLDGSTEIVWNSPYFDTGNFSHLSTSLGCYSLGPLTAATVTVFDILDFDPQPSCQDCIQCNGVILTLTQECPVGSEPPTYNVLSYQYAAVNDVIWDPYNGACATVLAISNDINQPYEYTFYSFKNLGTDCTICENEFTPPTTYTAVECISGDVVLISSDNGTLVNGNVIKGKWGTSDFLCYEINDAAVDPFLFFYYSDTVTPFDSCTGCTTTGRVGLTLINCDTYAEKFVNVDLETWSNMSGFGGGLSTPVVKGDDGQCYFLINDCPISTANTETFTTNEYYYYCFQCSATPEPSSCKCYYGVGSADSVVSGTYLDCSLSGTVKSFYSDNGLIKFCGTLIDGNNIFYSGNACEDGRCPNFCCNCYKIENNNESLLYVRYLDCDNNLINLEITGGTSTTFCGLNVQYLTSIITYTPTPPTGVIQTVDVCVEGKCFSDLTTSEKLLYGIKSKFEPCPEVCCGNTAYFGAYKLRGNGNTPGTYSIR